MHLPSEAIKIQLFFVEAVQAHALFGFFPESVHSKHSATAVLQNLQSVWQVLKKSSTWYPVLG